MTTEEQIDWLCRLRAYLNSGVIFTPWNKEFTEALNNVLEQEANYNSVNSLAESKLKNQKAKNFDVVRFMVDNSELSTFEIIEKAYLMGVSEKEYVLDKYRTEQKGGYSKWRFSLE